MKQRYVNYTIHEQHQKLSLFSLTNFSCHQLRGYNVYLWPNRCQVPQKSNKMAIFNGKKIPACSNVMSIKILLEIIRKCCHYLNILLLWSFCRTVKGKQWRCENILVFQHLWRKRKLVGLTLMILSERWRRRMRLRPSRKRMKLSSRTQSSDPPTGLPIASQ